jgi:hypothetical protein
LCGKIVEKCVEFLWKKALSINAEIQGVGYDRKFHMF